MPLASLASDQLELNRVRRAMSEQKTISHDVDPGVRCTAGAFDWLSEYIAPMPLRKTSMVVPEVETGDPVRCHGCKRGVYIDEELGASWLSLCSSMSCYARRILTDVANPWKPRLQASESVRHDMGFCSELIRLQMMEVLGIRVNINCERSCCRGGMEATECKRGGGASSCWKTTRSSLGGGKLCKL